MLTPEIIAEQRQKRYNGTVASIKKAHSDLMILKIKPDFAIPSHVPGQYCTLGLGNWEPRLPGCQEEALKEADHAKVVRRAYSLSCSMLGEDQHLLNADRQPYLEFYISLVRQGDAAKPPGLTPRLFMLQDGDRLAVGEKITGHYNLEHVGDPQATVLFLGTGTGEAPHNFMIWELLKKGHTGKIIHACCVRYNKDLAYNDTHARMMELYPNYRYLRLTTREAHLAGEKVYIQDLITSGQLEQHLGQPLDPAHTHVYLCGNPKMIGIPHKDPTTHERSYPTPLGVIEILERRGFRVDEAKHPGNIHFEKYW